MKKLLIILFLLIINPIYSQKYVQIIEKTEANKNLFERNSPTSLFSILEYNTIEIHPMDSASEELMRPYIDLKKDYFTYSEKEIYSSPIKTKNGNDSLVLDPITKTSMVLYPKRDKLISIIDSLTHLIILYDSTVQSKKNFSHLSIERIYFARKINNIEKLVCTGWFSFKELFETDKLNCISSNEFTNKNVLLKSEEFKLTVKNTVLEWEKETRKKLNLSDYVDEIGPRDEIFIEENETFSFFLNTVNPLYWQINWINFKSLNYLTNQNNRYNILFDKYFEIEKENFGENQIITYIGSDYPLVNSFGEDSMLQSIDGAWTPIYPVKRIIVWADYPTNKLHFRYSIQLDDKLGLTYVYKLEEIYLVGEIDGKEKCIYNFNRKDLSEREYFKDLFFPEFERTFYESLNKSKTSTPDFLSDLMNSTKEKNLLFNLSKPKEKFRFSELIDLPK